MLYQRYSALDSKALRPLLFWGPIIIYSVCLSLRQALSYNHRLGIVYVDVNIAYRIR